jgi:hypothetical protein
VVEAFNLALHPVTTPGQLTPDLLASSGEPLPLLEPRPPPLPRRILESRSRVLADATWRLLLPWWGGDG